MEPYLHSRGHQLTASHLYRGEALPVPEDFDWLIVMGGPMGIHDEADYPWLAEEKQLLRAAIRRGKGLLGICLGAQLIADSLGAAVVKNTHREIGWFPITPAEDLSDTILGSLFPPGLEAFHWHGDRFDIPAGAVPLASSEACPNQGFVLDDRIIGLQFHLETTPESARALIENCRDELDGSRYVQSAETMLADEVRFTRINGVMQSLLAQLEL